MRLHLILLALTVAGSLVGCGHRPIGHFGDGAFYHARGHYRIRYAEGPALLSSRWQLFNYEHDASGRPTDERVAASGVTTLDTAWLLGRGRSAPVRMPSVDLLYRERSGSGEIWVRTMVLPQAWENATSQSVLHAWATAVVQSRAPADPLSGNSIGQRAAVTHFGDARVDTLPAHWVELDVMQNGVPERMTVVGVIPGENRFRYRRRQSFPMMLVFGYSSTPEEHETVRQDFERLVARVDIQR